MSDLSASPNEFLLSDNEADGMGEGYNKLKSDHELASGKKGVCNDREEIQKHYQLKLD